MISEKLSSSSVTFGSKTKPKRKPNPRLFTLPYAGGSSRAIYSKWRNHLSTFIDLKPIEISGRGRRISDSLPATIEDAATDAFDQIKDELSGGDYSFFGHSMGCLITFEICRKIFARNLPAPKCLFLSANRPPHISEKRKRIGELPDDQFIDNIRNLGGLPEAVFEHPELLELMIPIIRNDYAMTERYKFTSTIVRWPVDVVFLHGTSDPLLSLDEASEWGKYTSATFSLLTLSGGHMFIEEHHEEICNIISQHV